MNRSHPYGEFILEHTRTNRCSENAHWVLGTGVEENEAGGTLSMA